FPLNRTVGAIPLTVNFDEATMYAQGDSTPPVQVIIEGIPVDVLPPVPHDGSAPTVEAFLRQYPKLEGFKAIYVKGIFPGGAGVVHLEYPSGQSDYGGRVADARAHMTLYRLHDWYSFPVVGKNS